MKVDIVVGGRPNLVKAAAILEAAKKFPELEFKLVSTGQHRTWDDIYWRDLQLALPEPSRRLALGTHLSTLSRQARYFEFLERVYKQDQPDAVMVLGDMDSTLAGALVAAKMGIPVVHVEAGLRCGQMKMQEEVNRILVDSIATRHYATTEGALNNLRREGHVMSSRMVGNVMVDSLYRFLPEAQKRYRRSGPYAVFTLHRAENVDDPMKLAMLVSTVDEIGIDIPVIWPVHPRTKAAEITSCINKTEPMGYLQFIALLDGAKFVMTDSGGVQEETTALGVPCMTLRENTERPETCHLGTNVIVGDDCRIISKTARRFMAAQPPFFRESIPGWDGCASVRLLEDLCRMMS